MNTEMFIKNSHSIFNRSSDDVNRNSNKINRTSNKLDMSSNKINASRKNKGNVCHVWQHQLQAHSTFNDPGWLMIIDHIKKIFLTWFKLQLSIFFTSGLAHLLEHTIFHASELFPTEGFSQFLRFVGNLQTRSRSWSWRIIFLIYGSMRGGSSNAFTASTYTNFHFDVPKEHFLDALDRWNTNFQFDVPKKHSLDAQVKHKLSLLPNFTLTSPRSIF